MGVVGRVGLAVGVVSAIAASVFACWVGGADFLLLVGPDVLRPADVALILWSFGVLVSALLIVVIVGRHRLQLLERQGRAVLVGALLVVALVGTGAWCVGQALVLGAPAALEPNAYTVLRPSGGGRGCALIAHENGRLRTSGGRVYAANGFGWATTVGSLEADEIQLPVRDSTYSLSWSGAVGAFSLRGSRAINPDHLQVTCAR